MTPGIRPAAAADHRAIGDLWETAWTSLIPSIDFAARRPWFDAHLAELASRGTDVLVAESSSEVVGFVTVDRRTGEMDQLAVARDRQGRGIGTMLISAAKTRSPGVLYLTVNVANTGAIALYTRCGFAITREGVNARSGLPVQHMAWKA